MNFNRLWAQNSAIEDFYIGVLSSFIASIFAMASGDAKYIVGLKTGKFDGEGWYLWRHKMELVFVSS